MLEPYTCHKNDDIDFAQKDTMREFNGFPILFNWHLSHRRADEWLTAKTFDQPTEIVASPAFQGCDAEPVGM